MNTASDRYGVRSFVIVAMLALGVALGLGISSTTSHVTAPDQLAQPMPEENSTSTFATSGDPYLGATLEGGY